MPDVDDWVDYGDRRIVVREVDGRRVGRVLVTGIPPMLDPALPRPEQEPEQQPAPEPDPEHERARS